MTTNNPMDEMTAKEREEAMGLTEAQRLTLESAGLTKKEIDLIHAQRVAESIAKERERLDKLEAKVTKKLSALPEVLSSLLGGDADKVPHDEDGGYDAEELKKYLPEGKLPWDGRDDLIMSNAEFWAEINRVAPPSKEELEEGNILEMSDEEAEAAAKRFYDRINSKPTEEAFHRRQLGSWKAEYEWIKGGCKGEKPEGVAPIINASCNPYEWDKM